jgi:two-component system sensor histidine kinase NblS
MFLQLIPTQEQNKIEKLVCENFLEGLIFLNIELKIIYINSYAKSLFKLKKNLKFNFLNFFPHEISLSIIKKLKEILRFKNTNFVMDEIILEYGDYDSKKKIYFKFQIIYQNEIIQGVLIKTNKISKQINYKKQRINFLTNISHELRTPLFNIQSFIQLLSKYTTKLKKKEIKEFLIITNTEILRLNQLVNKILKFSKFSKNNNNLKIEINIEDIFKQLVQIYTIRLKKKNLKIKQEINLNSKKIFVKKDLVFQIFDNIIGNAVKFSYCNDEIFIRSYLIKNKIQEKIRIEIGDTGIGISKKNQSNIFKKFFKMEEQIKVIYGSGLGLSIVKKILDKNNIQIFLNSQKQEGTIFFFDFNI